MPLFDLIAINCHISRISAAHMPGGKIIRVYNNILFNFICQILKITHTPPRRGKNSTFCALQVPAWGVFAHILC